MSFYIKTCNKKNRIRNKWDFMRKKLLVDFDRRLLCFVKALIYTLLFAYAEGTQLDSIADILLLEIIAVPLIFMEAHKTIRCLAATILSINFFSLSLESACYQVSGSSFNDAFYFHLKPNILYFFGPNLLMAVFFLLNTILMSILNNILFLSNKPTRRNYKRIFSLLLTLVLALCILHSSSTRRLVLGYLQFENIIENDIDTLWFKNIGINFIENNRLSVVNRELEKGKPRNLVLVYVESLEESFFDENLYPGLMPNLSGVRARSLQVKNIEQARGTGWTIAGIFASQCGYPLEVLGGRVGIEEILESNDSSDIPCFGDVLNLAGYSQTFIQGTSIRFAGIDNFIKAHGNMTKVDITDFSVDDSAKSEFGVRDRIVLERSLEMVKNLSRNNQNYSIAVSTIDTHFPGDPDPLCNPYVGPMAFERSEQRILDAAHCLDSLLAKFIKSVQKYDPNAVVAVMPDHLMQGKVPAWSKRSLYFFATGSGIRAGVIDGGTHFDIAPTLLGILGLKANYEFILGKNLLEDPSPLHKFAKNIPKSAYNYLESKLKNDRMRRIDCEGGIHFDRELQQMAVGEFKVRTGSIMFQNDIIYERWKPNKLFYLRVDQEGRIVQSDFFYSPSRVTRLLKSKGGIVIGMVGALPIVCRDKSCHEDWGIISTSAGRNIQFIRLERDQDFYIQSETCKSLVHNSVTVPTVSTVGKTGERNSGEILDQSHDLAL